MKRLLILIFSAWSLQAATLYHVLTGQMPAPATDRASGVDLVPPRSLNPTVSEITNEYQGRLELSRGAWGGLRASLILPGLTKDVA